MGWTAPPATYRPVDEKPATPPVGLESDTHQPPRTVRALPLAANRTGCYGACDSDHRHGLVLKRGGMAMQQQVRIRLIVVHTFFSLCVLGLPVARGQGLGGAGTVQGTVKDPTGGVMVAVTVDINNPVSGFKRSTTTDAVGKFVFRNLPPNSYQLLGERAGVRIRGAECRCQKRGAGRSRSLAARLPAPRARSRWSAMRRTSSNAIRRRTPTSIRA